MEHSQKKMSPVAYAHDWLDSYRGGEKVLHALLSLYPHADIYTLFYSPERMPSEINQRTIHTPWLLRMFRKIRKTLLPIFPFIVEFWPRKKLKLLISTSSCVVKSLKAETHICYIHSPMRYIWDQEDIYLEPFRKWFLIPQIIKFINIFLREWDRRTAQRVDLFICNSHFVAKRVKKFYRRDSIVIHPPIEDAILQYKPRPKKNYFIAAGAFVWYKRFDLAIEACEALGLELVIAGSGPYMTKLHALAGSNTRIIENPSDEEFRSLLSEAKALLFPGIEDFGMIAIESMALGTPVIAYRNGGALDFINPDTGLFFDEPNAQSLAQALQDFDKIEFNVENLKTFASSFSKENFLRQISNAIDKQIGRDI